jgi:hypothetical protein
MQIDQLEEKMDKVVDSFTEKKPERKNPWDGGKWGREEKQHLLVVGVKKVEGNSWFIVIISIAVYLQPESCYPGRKW